MAEPKAPETGKTGTEGTPPSGDQGNKGEGADKRFTQAELDTIVQDRVKKAQSGRVDLSEFGVKTKDELKAIVDAKAAADEAAKDERTKAVEEAKKEGRTEAEAELMGKANARLVKSEFTSLAKDRGVIDAQALYLIAKGEGRLEGLKVTDTDDVEGMDDAFWEEVLKGREYFVKQGAGSPTPTVKPTPGNVNGGTSGGTKVPADRRTYLEDQYPALARRKR